jgi:hypothetical protein
MGGRKSYGLALGLSLAILVLPVRAQQADSPIAAPVQDAPTDTVPKPDKAVSPIDPTESVAVPSSSNKPAPPLKRRRYTVAILQVLDKVTAQTLRFEATVNKPVRYKSVVITVRTCELSAGDESVRDAFVNLQIDSVPAMIDAKPAAPGRQLFKGWMFASSPGLNAFQHQTYDVWVITCKTSAPAA